ncbi:TetR/AcrR family transcriptional regulator [uncultured Enterovirga sp.]|uniref:TetR/AcrR family transcriptional regulator n=1 Tax=uncultured Enterovirga sp. TaxID=2026352 RepID=UPI0035C9DCA8
MRGWRGPSQREAGAPDATEEPDAAGDRRGYHHGNLKEALIQAARRFIAERGLGGFTLVDAAKLVGVTPAALYRHFRGREALVAEVAFRGYGQLAERLARALAGSGTPLERFTRMGETYLDFAEKEPGYYAAMFAARPPDTSTEPPSPWGRPRGAFDLLVEALGRIFPDGFGSVDPRFIALEVWVLAHGIATLDAAGQLPKGAGLPGKHELLRAGILAIVHGATGAARKS